MDWTVLDEAGISLLHEKSFDPAVEAVIIFKHSPRCSISNMAKDRLERKWHLKPEAYPAFYIDVLSSRSVSNMIADQYGVVHESPQILVIKAGKCIYTASHSEISFPELLGSLNN